MTTNDLFLSPPAAYRGKPFWAWNGKLTTDEIRRQVRVLQAMGLGGGFMHSRVGLATPYLQDEWFDVVRACCDECRKLGLEAWLYDEDRWPSGAAGGLVTCEPAYRHRHLVYQVQTPAGFAATGDEVGVWLAKLHGNVAQGLRPYSEAAVEDGDSVLAFTVQVDAETPWHNGQTYLDTMNEEAVARFIEVTHEAYAERVLPEFDAAVVPGIFTDEPNHGHQRVTPAGGQFSWTARLPEVFRERYGYDLIPHLPELAYVVDDRIVSRVRRDFHDCLTHLFTAAFARQIGVWCDEHNLEHTGHVLEEPGLERQTNVVGSAMRFYEHMQAPGIDILCGQGLAREGGSTPEWLTAKQCSSVKHQFGRRWMLSETYGCTGWHFTFAEHKAVGDWQAALGVNLRCHQKVDTMVDRPVHPLAQSALRQNMPGSQKPFQSSCGRRNPSLRIEPAAQTPPLIPLDLLGENLFHHRCNMGRQGPLDTSALRFVPGNPCW